MSLPSPRVVLAVLARPFLFLLYFLAGFVPRREDLWVFGSWGGQRFADNSAAFFLFAQEHLADDLQLVWISHRREIVADLRARGYEAHGWWTPRGVARCLRAGLHLFDCFAKDTNFWLSRGAGKINLWSGVPLKTFERDIDNPRNRYHRLFHGSPPERLMLSALMPWHVERPDLVIATSRETATITRSAFGVAADAVAVTGFPRNDRILNDPREGCRPSPHRSCPPAVREAVAAGKRVFLYLPTFRDSARPFLDVDWGRLDALMASLDAVFFLKFHPVDTTRYSGEHARIVQLFQDTDVYDVLPCTDALVSDFSSVIFDYMLLGRPVVYFTPDLEEFVASSRALNFHPEELAVGPLCRTFDELLAALEQIGDERASSAGDEAGYGAARARLHDHVDGRSSERVLAAIERRFPGVGRRIPGIRRPGAPE